MNQTTVQMLIFWVVIIVVFYLLLFLPEKKKQKKFDKMVHDLKVGDEIITRGGIYGRISNLQDDYMIIESGLEKTKIKVTRNSVSSVIESKPEEEKQ